jgi:hypothetical protein
MVEEPTSHSFGGAAADTGSAVEADSVTRLPQDPRQVTAPEEPHESSTRGMLLDAIQKVKDEIAYHEQEAAKHVQKAEELRKDLRETYAFLQSAGGKGKSLDVAAARSTDDGPERAAGKARESTAEARPVRGPAKKAAPKSKKK